MSGAANRKPRQGRRAHLNWFLPDGEGTYGYRGAAYAYAGGACSRRRFLLELWLWAGLMAAAVVAAGCIPAPGMDNCFYVLLPYLGEVASAGSLLWALARMTAGGDPLRAYVYEATVTKLPRRGFACMAFAGIGAIGCIAFLLFQPFSGPIWAAVLFFALKLLVMAAAFMIKCRMALAKWRKDTGWPEDETA